MQRLFFLFLLLAAAFCAPAQNKFTIAFNQGFGQLPTFTAPGPGDVVTEEKARALFRFLKDSAQIEWRYSYAGCEKRAHAAALLLGGKNVRVYKIWNFDPSYISLMNRAQKPSVPSRAGLSPTVSWGYHVAVLLFVGQGNEPVPMVLDPAVSDSLLTHTAWLALQQAPSSYYTFLDARWYNYATTDKFRYSCGNTWYPMPPCMQPLLTGDFFLNDGVSLTDLWVEEALAVNEVAMRIIGSPLLRNDAANSARRQALVRLVENFDGLTNALKGQYPDYVMPYRQDLVPFAQQFAAAKARWTARLQPLRP